MFGRFSGRAVLDDGRGLTLSDFLGFAEDVFNQTRLQHPDVAEKALADGQTDFIAIGRGLLAEPEWVNKIQSGRTAELRFGAPRL